MESPSKAQYYLSEPDVEIVHFGPGRIAQGLFFPKVEQASRERYAQNGRPIGMSAVFRNAQERGYDALKEQGGLYAYQTVGNPPEEAPTIASLPAREGAQAGKLGSSAIIGGMRNILVQQDATGIARAFKEPSLKLVTASVTVAAYAAPDDDLVQDAQTLSAWLNDRQNGVERPQIDVKTTFGAMTLGLIERFEATGTLDVTLLSLENLRDNGRLLKSKLVHIAQALSDMGSVPPRFLQLIQNLNAPATMIDRIVPRPPDTLILRTQDHVYRCQAGVVTEPHGRVVVAQTGQTPDDNLKLLDGEIEITQELDKHADAKASMLNAVHALSGAIWLGLGSDAQTLPEFLAKPGIRNFICGLMTEIGNTLDPISDLDIRAYQDQLMTRFENKYLADDMSRISDQLYRKSGQYVAPVVQRALRKSVPMDHLSLAVSALVSASEQQDPHGRDVVTNTLVGGDSALAERLDQTLNETAEYLTEVGLHHLLAACER
jgi:mannitol-1-phosphate/altronate dehydrogenase